MSSFLYRR